MKLRDFGENALREWLQQILEWSRKKVSIPDNLDCVLVTANIGVAETEVGHPLGRTPQYVIEVAAYPNGTAGIEFTRPPEINKLWLKRGAAGNCTLLLF